MISRGATSSSVLGLNVLVLYKKYTTGRYITKSEVTVLMESGTEAQYWDPQNPGQLMPVLKKDRSNFKPWQYLVTFSFLTRPHKQM